MCDLPRQDQFLLESPQDVWMPRQLRANHFQRHQSVDLAISSLVNRSHATLPEQF
jgi:hypothetical protein